MAEAKYKEEQKYNLRMAGIICSTILGFFSLIGLFWGSDGIINFLAGVFFLFLFGCFIMIPILI